MTLGHKVIKQRSQRVMIDIFSCLDSQYLLETNNTSNELQLSPYIRVVDRLWSGCPQLHQISLCSWLIASFSKWKDYLF